MQQYSAIFDSVTCSSVARQDAVVISSSKGLGLATLRDDEACATLCANTVLCWGLRASCHSCAWVYHGWTVTHWLQGIATMQIVDWQLTYSQNRDPVRH